MLNERLTGYLTYFERLATQPINRWDGFFMAQHTDRGLSLRHQLAFPCYALGAICMHPESDAPEQERCRTAMAALIDRMLQRRIWAHWAELTSRAGFRPDPVMQANAQYSGHLAMMIGLYELVGGDNRYDDDGFTFIWSPDERFHYTHTSLVETIWRQMRSNSHHAVESEPGQVHIHCMNHVMWSNVFHDRLHGTTYASIHDTWLDFVRQRLVLSGPYLIRRGIFVPCYTRQPRLSALFGMGFIDAWVLSFLAPLAPALTRELAPRFLQTIRHVAHSDTSPPQAYVPSARAWQQRELADGSIANGFGYILAVELADDALATALQTYADTHLQPLEQAGERCYCGGMAPVYTTALFALGEAGGLHPFRALLDSPADVPGTTGLDAEKTPTRADQEHHEGVAIEVHEQQEV